MTDFVLGKTIRIHDQNGDGVFQSSTDKITSIHNDTAIPESDLQAEVVKRQLGVDTLEGIRLEEAHQFLESLQSAKTSARNGDVDSAKAETVRAGELARKAGTQLSQVQADKIERDALVRGARFQFEEAAKDAVDGAPRVAEYHIVEGARYAKEARKKYGIDDTPYRRAAHSVMNQAFHNYVFDEVTVAEKLANEGGIADAAEHLKQAREMAQSAKTHYGVDVKYDPEKAQHTIDKNATGMVDESLNEAEEAANDGFVIAAHQKIDSTTELASSLRCNGANVGFDQDRANQILQSAVTNFDEKGSSFLEPLYKQAEQAADESPPNLFAVQNRISTIDQHYYAAHQHGARTQPDRSRAINILTRAYKGTIQDLLSKGDQVEAERLTEEARSDYGIEVQIPSQP